jgi:hypothetical protein
VTENPKWRIDALDARAGLAFASYRTSHFSETDASERPSLVFIGAPSFQPEMIANRSIALTSIRGSFQHRLYVGEDEVAFPNLPSIVEFVRRAYLRGGGGDGGDGTTGGGPTPPPITPLDRPDFPSLPKGELDKESIVGAIVKSADQISQLSQFCSLGEIRDLAWPGTSSSIARQTARPVAPRGEVALANASVALIYEMMHRMPSGRDPFALLRWHEDARRLGYIIATMGLWPILGGNPYRSYIINVLKPLRHWETPPPSLTLVSKLNDDELLAFACSLFFGDGPALDAPQIAERLLQWIRHLIAGGDRLILVGPRKFGYVSDPVSDLAAIPCQQSISDLVLPDAIAQISLYHILLSATGSPGLLARQELCELVLFAATWIVAHRDRPTMDWLDRRDQEPATPVTLIGVQSKANRGWSWLREHLPPFCFSEQIEDIINASVGLRYEESEATGPPTGGASSIA